ncbi:MAG: sigma-E factor negative regulatory protein [Nitrosomonas sp.]|nr:sigma-E factor negative regulatory protein [Nitrosomonas sp.]
MKNKVSELMDGELSNQDAEKTIAALKREDLLYRDWEIYHLIGDTLRQSSNLTTNVTERVNRQLASEPTLLISASLRKSSNPAYQSRSFSEKNKSGSSKIKVFAFATAASLFAMISTWLVMQNVYQQSHPVIVAEQSRIQAGTDLSHVPMSVIHSPTGSQYPYIPNGDITTYLYFHNFHKELSPGPALVRHPVYNIHPVTDSTDNYGR